MYVVEHVQVYQQIEQFVYDVVGVVGVVGGDVEEYGVYVEKLGGIGGVEIGVCGFGYQYEDLIGNSLYVVIPKSVLTCSQPKISLTLTPKVYLSLRLII